MRRNLTEKHLQLSLNTSRSLKEILLPETRLSNLISGLYQKPDCDWVLQNLDGPKGLRSL